MRQCICAKQLAECLLYCRLVHGNCHCFTVSSIMVSHVLCSSQHWEIECNLHIRLEPRKAQLFSDSSTVTQDSSASLIPTATVRSHSSCLGYTAPGRCWPGKVMCNCVRRGGPWRSATNPMGRHGQGKWHWPLETHSNQSLSLTLALRLSSLRHIYNVHRAFLYYGGKAGFSYTLLWSPT